MAASDAARLLNRDYACPPEAHGGSCFVAGTSVETEGGPVNIENLQRDTTVLARMPEAHVTHSAPILRMSSGLSETLVDIELHEETITCTPEHPFWVVGCGWVKAGNLRSGALLINVHGEEMAVLDVQRHVLANPIRVYGITVGDESTYFVGKSKVLVHNKQ